MAHKVFVSYHHAVDQQYANMLRDFYGASDFLDRSLPARIDSDNDDYILRRIRTEHLKDSTVTIVLVGAQTWSRKWVDWEIYSSLRPYGERSVNGLLGILLPSGRTLPSRFADNYQEMNFAGRTVQVGYARIVPWSEIRPPNILDTVLGMEQTVARTNRAKLVNWIEQAFENRNSTAVVNNQRPRFTTDLPVWPWWL